MEVENSGWYRTRDGRLAEVVVHRSKRTSFCAVGFIEGDDESEGWTTEGLSIIYETCVNDLIQYLGKERPAERKTVKMAPALFCINGVTYGVTSSLYKSEQHAKSQLSDFVRWLIDTPMAVDVEVQE